MTERDKLMEQLSELNLGFHPSGEYYCCAAEKVADFILADRKAVLERAIELLNKCESIFDEMDAVTWDDDSQWQGSSYDEVADDVREYLSEIDRAMKGDV